MNTPVEQYLKAQRHLARRDPVLKELIKAVGPCTLQRPADPFLVLVRSVISQLISTKAAASIFARLEARVGGNGVTSAAVAVMPEDALRGVGLSRTKTRALTELARRAEDGSLPLADLAGRTDEEVIEVLIPIPGIGKWTAEMFLIFGLGRLDVLPVDDFGLRAGVQDHYGLEALPGKVDLRARAEPWRPYRSIATWYFWRSRGFVPQSAVGPVANLPGRKRQVGNLPHVSAPAPSGASPGPAGSTPRRPPHAPAAPGP
jgi:DNA-3-methyladenine glycosylase II